MVCSSHGTLEHTLDFRLVVQKLRREFTHAQYFLFKITAQSARMREFSSRFLDNQPEIECSIVLLANLEVFESS